jgi:hypothetical protein
MRGSDAGMQKIMERAIVGFETDEAGDWVALLRCGHHQHVRHRPPFQVRPWTLTTLGRASKVGTQLNCVLCDEQTAETMPGDIGGSPACLAAEVCSECGGLDSHRPDCSQQLPPRGV